MLTPTEEKKRYADYAALEEGAPYQLIDGELVLSPAPTVLHQLIVWKLGTRLFNYVEKHELGVVVGSPIDVYLSDTETYQPDLVFISQERRDRITEPYIKGAPDLVVEVLSPSTGYYDLTQKRRTYETAGVKEYWIIDPKEKTIDILFNLEGSFETLIHAYQQGEVSSRLLNGFAISLENLFSF